MLSFGGKVLMIEFYDFGKIIIDGNEYTSDVIVYPDRVEANWWRKVGHEICLDDIKDVLSEKPDVLVVGTGYSGLVRVLPEVKEALKEKEIELKVERTKRACDIFNELSKSVKVVAALHLTC
jgi:hypothetical protein